MVANPHNHQRSVTRASPQAGSTRALPCVSQPWGSEHTEPFRGTECPAAEGTDACIAQEATAIRLSVKAMDGGSPHHGNKQQQGLWRMCTMERAPAPASGLLP